MATDKSKKAIKKEDIPNNREAKLSALKAAMGQIEKSYGRGAIMRLGDDAIEQVEVIPAGSIG